MLQFCNRILWVSFFCFHLLLFTMIAALPVAHLFSHMECVSKQFVFLFFSSNLVLLHFSSIIVSNIIVFCFVCCDLFFYFFSLSFCIAVCSKQVKRKKKHL